MNINRPGLLRSISLRSHKSAESDQSNSSLNSIKSFASDTTQKIVRKTSDAVRFIFQALPTTAIRLVAISMSMPVAEYIENCKSVILNSHIVQHFSISQGFHYFSQYQIDSMLHTDNPAYIQHLQKKLSESYANRSLRHPDALVVKVMTHLYQHKMNIKLLQKDLQVCAQNRRYFALFLPLAALRFLARSLNTFTLACNNQLCSDHFSEKQQPQVKEFNRNELREKIQAARQNILKNRGEDPLKPVNYLKVEIEFDSARFRDDFLRWIEVESQTA